VIELTVDDARLLWGLAQNTSDRDDEHQAALLRLAWQLDEAHGSWPELSARTVATREAVA